MKVRKNSILLLILIGGGALWSIGGQRFVDGFDGTESEESQSRVNPVGVKDGAGECKHDGTAPDHVGQMSATKRAEYVHIGYGTEFGVSVTGLIKSNLRSVALISVSGDVDAPYVVGDEVIAGVVLEKILCDSVVVRHNGSLSKIRLTNLRSGQEASVAEERHISTGEVAALPAHASALDREPVEGVARVSKYQYTISRELLAEQLDSPEFINSARISPEPEGGFLVERLVEASFLEDVGVRVGDVIQDINGQTVNSLDDFVSIYQDLDNVREVQVKLLRDGQVQYIFYEIE